MVRCVLLTGPSPHSVGKFCVNHSRDVTFCEISLEKDILNSAFSAF